MLLKKNKDTVPPLLNSIVRDQKVGDPFFADKFEDGTIALADVNEEQMVSITDNVNEILLSLRQYSPNDTENIQEVLHASAKAILFLKNQLASLQPMSSTLLSIDPLFETLTTSLQMLRIISRALNDLYQSNTHTLMQKSSQVLVRDNAFYQVKKAPHGHDIIASPVFPRQTTIFVLRVSICREATTLAKAMSLNKAITQHARADKTQEDSIIGN